MEQRLREFAGSAIGFRACQLLPVCLGNQLREVIDAAE